MSKRALSGLRVFEYAQGIPGPFCGKLLADYGADVVKVEDPNGDWTRRRGPFAGDSPHLEKSGLFLYLNTSKQGVTLNVASPTGGQLFRRLLQQADALILGDTPLELGSVGLGVDVLRREFPRLVVLDITGFGRTGPYAAWKSADLLTFHMSGLAWVTPETVADPPNEPPLKGAGHLADFYAGLTAAAVLLTHLLGQSVDGHGCAIDLSAWDAVVQNMTREIAQFSLDGSVPGRSVDSLHSFGAGGLIPCKDGFVKIYFTEPHMWKGMAELMGKPEWVDDPRYKERAARAKNWGVLRPQVEAFCHRYNKHELARMCQAKGVPAAPVNTVAEVFEEPQVRARGLLRTIDHPVAGPVVLPGAPFRLVETPCTIRGPAPLLGQDNVAVWCDRLGLSREELVALRTTGVI
ncbi:MAG: CoA transferase [Chloroflexi bacterium]|nr:CoA transferase [Chloroflexota bacterium]